MGRLPEELSCFLANSYPWLIRLYDLYESNLNNDMENTAWLDWALGGLAIIILLAGLVMLFGGVATMNRKQ